MIAAGNDGVDHDSRRTTPALSNRGRQASPPVSGATENVVCIAATDQADQLAGFSDWRASSVDLEAPGTEILSTYPFVQPLAEDFEVDDISSRWPATGPDGGFERTDEAPLASFGLTEEIGRADDHDPGGDRDAIGDPLLQGAEARRQDAGPGEGGAGRGGLPGRHGDQA